MVKIKQIDIDECIDGNVIAEDVRMEGINIPIVIRNSIINDYIKSKLINYNIKSIQVIQDINALETDNYKQQMRFVKEYKDLVLQVKLMFNNAVNGKSIIEDDLVKLTNRVLSNSEVVSKVIEVIDIMRNHDEYTYTHSINVALYAMFIGKWMNLNEEEIKILIHAGILHDIGKIKIPLTILNKPDILTEKEFARIKEHSNDGYNFCKASTWLHSEVKEAVLSHHEREDGSGYPRGLKKEQISVYSKIIAIADVYDALTSERVYKPRQTPFDTFKHMIREGYQKYDIGILNTFLDYISFYYVGSKVRLSDNRVGEIIFIHPHNIIYPTIKVDDEYFEVNNCNQIKIVEFVQ
ncbi:MAG: HD-GYP domain-containing protein [Firmicutes bacterium HGW-Firmicutes-7]|nr:MAG: HD-GYP domain-containing protein [Firmicutes bacterium HGW-Firmicutes-7]